MLADIIIVDGDPLKGIKVLQDKNKIKMVMKEGKIEVKRARSAKYDARATKAILVLYLGWMSQ